ncbi:amino acid ABC transporter permease [Ensifer sp. NM-2]|uniref:amino acid ABC transporter permease n=1 Tax=Ensifer sp. NM-2 TaxID=2109730 RepID=UPI001304F3FE|nr:amino acid ABC transporter permease [Ensifer sp. NM-2]
MQYVWDFSVVWVEWPKLLVGLGYTLLLTILSFALSVLLGMIICGLRVSSVRPIAFLAGVYIEFMRLTPLLVQMLWIYTSLALIAGIALSPFVAGLFALSMNSAAFLAEIFRSGLRSIPKGQYEATAVLGFTPWQSMRRIIGPQVFRTILPPLGSGWVSAFKDTSLLAVLGVPELLTQAQVISSATFRPLEVFITVGLIYLALAYPQALLVEHFYSRRKMQTRA